MKKYSTAQVDPNINSNIKIVDVQEEQQSSRLPTVNTTKSHVRWSSKNRLPPSTQATIKTDNKSSSLANRNSSLRPQSKSMASI